MKIVTVDQMRALETETAARGVSLDHLMENAGLRVAEKVSALLDGKPKGEHVTILVGPGNNGSDGMVAARHLDDWGARVHLYLCAPRPESDPKLEALRDHVVDIVDMASENAAASLQKALASSRVVVDAVLGAAHARRGIAGTLRMGLELLQAAKKRRPGLILLALDVPSGLNADTGVCDTATPYADVTVTLGFPKIGLFIFPGAGRVGALEVADIGIPEGIADSIDLELVSPDAVASLLPQRPLHANKGTFGSVLVVAGSARYIGAAALACAAAVRAGAGLVTLATPRSLVPVIAPMVPEATYIALEEASWGVVRGAECAKVVQQELSPYNTLLVGCGLGQSDETAALVQALLLGMPKSLTPKLLIDADGLNILSRVPNWWRQIEADVVVTPHPGEMRRLTDKTVEEIQTDRVGAAKDAAVSWRKTVLLKGAYSVIATPDGSVRINPFANPGLATAGTGDVLSGLIAGLMAQGLPCGSAAVAGAYIQGAAAEMKRGEIGVSGMAASDLLPLIPKAMEQLRKRS